MLLTVELQWVCISTLAALQLCTHSELLIVFAAPHEEDHVKYVRTALLKLLL